MLFYLFHYYKFLKTLSIIIIVLYIYIYIYIYSFFVKIISIYHVPGCSGMFRVPGFVRLPRELKAKKFSFSFYSFTLTFVYSPSGVVQMDIIMPETLTTWVMQAVAINNKTGLGLATPLRIVIFRDYFLSLKLPYSVKRGEQVSLLATVFNHIEEMRVSLKKEYFSDFFHSKFILAKAA